MTQRLAMIEAMIAKGSTDPFLFYGRAMEMRSVGRLEDALAAFAEVRAQFADYVPTYLMAAQVAVELSKPDVAQRWLEQGLEAAKRAGDAHAQAELQSLLSSIRS